MSQTGIVVIDDEVQIQKLLEITLRSHGFRVTPAASSLEGLTVVANHSPDLVILDLGLPDESGHQTLQRLREWYGRPVIILSVLNDEEHIVQALDNGANDYLVKPFRTRELLARIRSALRNADLGDHTPLIRHHALEFDLVARTVRRNGEAIKLTVTQYALLVLFARNEGKVLTHQYILKEVWGPDFANQLSYLRVFIAQLRKKIEPDPNRPEYIVTESGIGYRFVAPA